MPAPHAPVEYIEATRSTYSALGYPPYRWVHSADPPPWATPRVPLRESRLALISSGGIYATGQIAFHFRDDTSYRRIPTGVATSDLRATHFAYDLAGARRDPNTVFPIDTLRSLVADASLGALTSHALTFMGGIYSSRRVRDELAPALADRVQEMAADIVLLVPV